MNIYVNCILDFVIIFIIVFLFYIIFINRKRKNYEMLKRSNEVRLIINKHDLNMKKVKYKNLLISVAVANSIIFAFAAVLVINIKNMWIGMIVAFITVIMLIYSFYEIIGRHYKKKENEK